ncbi:trafficking protein particle complex subunit 8-like isoform X2 [Anneissia japonica]|uniref:trafficking protein particle complex subunit 8-like isoform X2 n=1 Tax=Anneissia japonica TaxID=1529436 RepID=UPI001425A224|nr:trafficking protein particle complex subunit 8-like isoform X2 [Anneissia japonica]
MAQCAQSAREFIQNSFGPMVAVLCSHDAEVLAQKNNLTFVEMARPFCRLTTEAHIRDPQGQVNSIRNLRIILNDMNSQPPSSAIVRKMLNDVVGSLHPNSEASKSNVVSAGNYDLQLSGSTPWFEAYREHFLQVTLPSEHEFIRHFIACMLVVSSNHADPIDQFSKLNQQQHQLQHSSSANNPKWLCPNIFKYYILLHDNTEGEEEKAEAVYQSMKSTYGSHACHLLRINSRSIQAAEVASMGNEYTANMPDPWSQFMTNSVEESGEMDISPSVDNGGFPDKVTETDPEHINDPTQPAEPLPIEDDSPVDPIPNTNPPHPLSQTNEVVSHPLDDQSAQTQMIITSDPDDTPDANNVDIVLKKLVGVHGACLTLSDHDRLRIFIHEFVVRGLLPYIEKMIRTLSEQLASRKGISRSFISATKNWFGGKRNAEKANKSQVDMGGKYLRESPELQMRRLGDLAFLVQMYELAYTSFHTAKRDFNNDHAYMHCAGALEMAATSAFMMGNLNKVYPSHYMDSAVSMYANTCKKPSFATRAILLSTETLKARGLYGEAAMEFIRMTGEDSDLRSALFLEQGAHCFINMKTPMARKYAFHMILAGHRYSKAGQRKHALRSYCQALQVYKGKGWTLAEDHINFTIGRQSFNLKQLDNASAAFKHLLTSDSRQPAVQQAAFLREYLFVFQQQMATATQDGKALSPGLPQLPLPIINKIATKVLLGSTIRPILPDNKIAATSVAFNQLYDSAETDKWFELEEMVVKAANKSALATLRPSQKLLNGRTNNSQRPIAVIREPITIELVLTNPLKVSLLLCNLCLLWRFTDLDYEKVNDETPEKPPTIISNENICMNIANEIIYTETIPEFELKANEIKAVQLSLTPQQTGELSILGIMYSLSTPMQSTSSTPVTNMEIPGSPSLKHSKKMGSNVVSVRGRQEVDVQGPRLNGTLMEKRVVTYGPDRRLDPIIAPPMPLLEACFIDFPYSLLCGEIGQTILEVSNKGDYPLHKLYIVSKQPQCFAFRSPNNSHVNADIQSGSLYRTIPLDNRVDVDEHVVDIQKLSCVVKVPLPEGHLKPGCSASIPMWIQGPEKAGIHDVDILFYYESTEENFKLRHRVLRHSAVINTTHSLCLKATATRGHIPEHNQGNQSLVVSLQVENMNQVHDTNITEFSVEQVTCVSKTWALEHIATKEKQEFKISGGESVICCLKAQHCKQIGQLDANQVVFTDGVLGKEKIMSFESPCSDFYFRSKLKLNDLESEPQEGSYTSQNNEGTSLKQLLEGALEVDLTLLVLWKAFVVDEAGISHKFVGQHHVTMAMLDQQISTIPTAQRMVEQKAVRFLKDVDVNNGTEPSSAVMIQLIKCSLQHPDHKEHDFTRKRLCTVPVTLHLCNCADMQLSVQVDTDTAQDNTPTDSSSGYYVTPKPPNSSDFVWVRRVSQQVTLAQETSHQIQLLACFSKPGVFNLSNIKVKVTRQSLGMQGEYIEQKKLLPSVITVSKTINNLKSSLES